MTRGNVTHWLQEHHLLPATQGHFDPANVGEFLKSTWLVVLLLLLGVMALITAVLVAWPALSYIGSHLMG